MKTPGGKLIPTSACKMKNEKKVKKSVQWDLMIIRLYAVDGKTVPIEGFNNIEAFDANENLLWIAELPQSRMDFYYDIKIDTANKILLAYTATSYLAEINLKNGKTLDFRIIK